MNASSVLGNTHAAPKTAEEAAEKESVRQKRGKIQSEWQDVISQGKVTPKRFEKQAVQKGVNDSLVLGKTRRAQKAADDAACSKKACRKQGAIQTEKEGVILVTKMTPKG